MDLFGDSDDEDGRGAPAVAIVELLNGLFTALVKHRSRNRASEDLAVGDLAIAVIVDGAEDLKLYSEPLLLKLRAAKFNNVTVTSTTNDVAGPVDAIVYFSSSHSHPAATLWHLVVPGGHVLVLVPEQCFAALCGADRWVYEGEAVTAAIAGEQYLGAVLRKRVLKCNTDGALYWATLSDQMEREVALAAEVTVCLTTHERSQGLLTDGSVQAAATALSTHGVVVIRGLFNAAAVVETAKLALLDLALAQEELLRRGIDLTRPGCGGPPINNYHELSMREAYRVDLRNGRHMKTAGSEGTAPQQNTYFRSNPSILRILESVMNPATEDVPHSFRGGNWGRWNFGGLGPDAPPPPPIAGEMGAVVTLPGCLDQTIHADTPHLFDHVQLPAHYINLFIPGVVDVVSEEEYGRIGQTAFICGSHTLETSARLMNTGDEGESELEELMIRPHVEPGDAIMFDCRVLHFGLANRSAATKRPVLYVNYHHPSFRDPKNWNEAERLFG